MYLNPLNLREFLSQTPEITRYLKRASQPSTRESAVGRECVLGVVRNISCSYSPSPPLTKLPNNFQMNKQI